MCTPALPIALRALPAAADDAARCGRQGRASTVSLFNGKGERAGRRTFERGELVKRESFW